MAHKSNKKHIKHLHQHELSATAPTAKKRPGAKADVEGERLAKMRARVGEPRGRVAKTGERSGTARKSTKERGIVRSIARAATKKIAAKPKKIIKRATRRVKSLLGRE